MCVLELRRVGNLLLIDGDLISQTRSTLSRGISVKILNLAIAGLDQSHG